MLSFFRLKSDVGFVHRNKFCESADAILGGPRIDFIACVESPHLRSDANHHPSHFIAQGERQSIRQKEFELAVSDLCIQRVDAGSVDLDQHIVVPQPGLWHFTKPSAVLAIAVDDECLHDMCPFDFLASLERRA